MIEVDPYDLSDDQIDEVTRLVEQEIAARPKQTIMDGENGNCLQAAVAMITGRPMVEVPNFSTFRSQWFEALMSWAEGAGFEVVPVVPAHWDEPVLAFGQSARGMRHCVVWDGDHMLHDPHPDNTGLVSVESEFWAITPKTESEDDDNLVGLYEANALGMLDDWTDPLSPEVRAEVTRMATAQSDFEERIAKALGVWPGGAF